MLWKLVILFIALPLIELWLIFRLASATSWWTAFLIVIATGVIGTAMAKSQGVIIWKKITRRLRQGELPGDALFDGLLLLIGGILLITPGLITDSIGIVLLVPFMRTAIRNHIRKRLKRAMDRGSTRFYFYSNETPQTHHEDAIDVEWEEFEEPPPESQGPQLPKE